MEITHLNTFPSDPQKTGKDGRLNSKKNVNKNRNAALYYTDYEMFSRILFVVFQNF